MNIYLYKKICSNSKMKMITIKFLIIIFTIYLFFNYIMLQESDMNTTLIFRVLIVLTR